MRNRLLVALALTALAVALVWWHGRGEQPAPPAVSATATALDVAAFRAHVANRRAAARTVHERLARATATAATGTTADAGTSGAPPTGDEPRGHLADLMVAPLCVLGPADLCASIADTVDACDGGDGRACLAVGQYLEDAPPRPMILISFYQRACQHGEPAGCTAMARFKDDAPTDCAKDPLPCAWRAEKNADLEGLDRACTFGVADACAMALELVAGDAHLERSYLERACQLGNPMACQQLGARLSPRCTDHCYPPDPAAAAAAATIACDVGFTAACAAAGP